MLQDRLRQWRQVTFAPTDLLRGSYREKCTSSLYHAPSYGVKKALF